MKRYILFTVFFCFLNLAASSQTVYSIDASATPEAPRNTLKLGGKGKDGQSISVNNQYITINGKPWIPITGEFHYCRYPEKYWDESLKKMKAGGINTVATYVFWNIHERKEGQFDWSGNKDLRKFISLCKKNGLYAIVRVGPFAHGEIRSGGLPDWLLGKPLSIRSNDPVYLSSVEKFYNQIGEQIRGTYFNDGGPVVGIQLENEYQHSAAPWGLTYPGQPNDMTAAERDLALTQEGVGVSRAENPYAQLGNDHMKILKELAVKAGMVTPLYTATGWGNAAIVPNESIPVTAAYAYPFWTPKKDISPFFLYKDMRRKPDYAPVRYNPEDYPVFPAELGSGIMTIYSRRPIAEHKSFDAMINRCLGSGANGVGYYMYHGGSTPHQDSYYFSDEAYGLPKISYDFQAPIGEFGQVREGYHRLKLLHSFLNDFGDRLAPMQTVLPANASSLKSDNITDLRYSVRSNGTSGFLFLNNFQDDTTMTPKKDLRFSIKTTAGTVNIPASGSFALQPDENLFLPFNLDVEGVNLRYATAQLMARMDDPENIVYVFFAPAGIRPEFSFAENISLKAINQANIKRNQAHTLVTALGDRAEFELTAGSKRVKFLVITKETALNSYRVTIEGKQRLVFSENTLIPADESFTILSKGNNKPTFEIYPKLSSTALSGNYKIDSKAAKSKSASAYAISLPESSFAVQTLKFGEKKFSIKLPELKPQLNNIFLEIDYTGDTAMGFIDGNLVADEFYKGIPWDIGLRDFLNTHTSREMVFYIRPLHRNATYLRDLNQTGLPDFGSGRSLLKLNSVKFVSEYKAVVGF
ncbi:beta-galactosidase [Paradesertivirga mongoliensis]|uniref:Beta-galactosidase n=1 Tax=Paradesertivirga mongoliensis TaxID=2100740 RepID=A0ABW4ZRC3_9SPHI|nr:beta-galactosidase [Pedobacter mongoliensis]